MKKIVEGMVLIIIALGLLNARDTSSGQTPPPIDIGEPLGITREADGTACKEEEPCWDCSTMGNLVCGPVVANPDYTG